MKGLECSICFGNIINRKVRNLYIEAIPKKKSQLRKKYIFELDKHLRFTFSIIIVHGNHSKPTGEYPYTPRIDRRNTHFQIMKKHFTGLENAFAGTSLS